MGPHSAQNIEREAQRVAPAELADFLQRHLGERLCAYIRGQNDLEEVPSSSDRDTSVMRWGYIGARLLLETYGEPTARTWFLGANELLGGRAPAEVLRHGESEEDWREIVPAAVDFRQSAIAPGA